MVTGEGQGGYRVPNASTATRTDTPLRDIPASIQVIPRQVIEDRNVERLQDALENVSGVTKKNNYGGTATGAALKQGKLIAPMTFSGSCNRDLFEVYISRLPRAYPHQLRRSPLLPHPQASENRK